MKVLLLLFTLTGCLQGAVAQQSSILLDECRKGNIDGVKKLVASDSSLINTKDEKGFTPLILAVYNNHVSLSQYLISKGANVNAQDNSGNTALMGAIFKGYSSQINLLVKSGADLNIQNFNGATALIFVANFGTYEMGKLLLESGANKSIKDDRGKTPLDHAVIQDNKRIIELLTK